MNLIIPSHNDPAQLCPRFFPLWKNIFSHHRLLKNPDRYMEITDPASAPNFSFPFVLDCHQFYELMVTQGEGRSPMTSSDAETDLKPIIIIIMSHGKLFSKYYRPQRIWSAGIERKIPRARSAPATGANQKTCSVELLLSYCPPSLYRPTQCGPFSTNRLAPFKYILPATLMYTLILSRLMCFQYATYFKAIAQTLL